VRIQGIENSFTHFQENGLEALAGLRPRLLIDTESMPGSRILDGQVTGVQQSVGTHKPRGKAAEFIRKFVEDVKRTGFVARTIEKHRIRGVTVAPPG
jgi:polar amino acid transport system substrate-binding protein